MKIDSEILELVNTEKITIEWLYDTLYQHWIEYNRTTVFVKYIYERHYSFYKFIDWVILGRNKTGQYTELSLKGLMTRTSLLKNIICYK